MDSKQALGEKVKAARNMAGMTQVQLAKKAGLSGDWVCSIERGHRRPDLCTVMHIAHALQITLDELVGNGKVNHKQKPKKKGKSNG